MSSDPGAFSVDEWLAEAVRSDVARPHEIIGCVYPGVLDFEADVRARRRIWTEMQ